MKGDFSGTEVLFLEVTRGYSCQCLLNWLELGFYIFYLKRWKEKNRRAPWKKLKAKGREVGDFTCIVDQTSVMMTLPTWMSTKVLAPREQWSEDWEVRLQSQNLKTTRQWWAVYQAGRRAWETESMNDLADRMSRGHSHHCCQLPSGRWSSCLL